MAQLDTAKRGDSEAAAMTPRRIQRRRDPDGAAREIAFEQVCFWAVIGLTYGEMLVAVGWRRRGFHGQLDRDFVVKRMARVWLRLQRA